VTELYEGLLTTRSIRRFTSEPVSDEDLAAILFAASRAPNGSNRNAFRFLVLRDGPAATEAKALLGDAFRRTWASMQRSGDYTRIAEPDLTTAAGRAGAAMQRFVDRFEEIPVVVLPCLVRYRRPDPTEGASIYPACQNLLLAARARGLGGVLTMWHGSVEAELRRVLGIPEAGHDGVGEHGVAIAATIPLGHPEGNHGPVRRRPLTDVVYDGTWGQAAAWAVDPEGTRFTR
jgi:nitroreductase